MKNRSMAIHLPQAFILIGVVLIVLALMAEHFSSSVVNGGSSKQQFGKSVTTSLFARKKPPPPPPYPTADNSAPTKPSGVSVTGTRRKLNVSWNGSQDEIGGSGVAGYELWRKGENDPPGNGSRLAITSASVLGYSDTAVIKGQVYCYTVRAFDHAGNYSDFSDPGCGSTLT